MKAEIQHYTKLFYTETALKNAIRDYASLGMISLHEEQGCFVCEFSSCAINTRRVMLEFNNYLIELMNQQGARAEE